jgi:hypothetical protein
LEGLFLCSNMSFLMDIGGFTGSSVSPSYK